MGVWQQSNMRGGEGDMARSINGSEFQIVTVKRHQYCELCNKQLRRGTRGRPGSSLAWVDLEQGRMWCVECMTKHVAATKELNPNPGG